MVFSHPPTLKVLLALCFVAVFLVGCGGKPRKPQGKFDTPSHHTLRGNDFLDQGQVKKAGDSFKQALSLEKKYSQAHGGMAVVHASFLYEGGHSDDAAEDLAEKAEDSLDNAFKYADNDEEERQAHLAGIRVNRLAKTDDDWLEEAQEHYESAVENSDSDPKPHFYMARAKRDAFELNAAQDLYRRVLQMRRGLEQEADNELSLLQQIIRAAPGSDYAKVVAFAPSISRADLAALLIEELEVGNLYARAANQSESNRFQPVAKASGFQTQKTEKIKDATDIENHPLRADIEEVLHLKIVGLEPDPAHLFHPAARVTRAEFAMIIEDVLVKVTGETALKTRFIGQASSFKDVRSDLAYFNAVQTATTRNLMEPANRLRGTFAPLEPVSGASALLALRQMSNELRSYTR